MELVLIIIILILLIANLVVVLTKNNRLQTERLELLLHEEMKANRVEPNFELLCSANAR